MKQWLSNIGTSISNMTGRTALKVQKNEPEILLGFGIVGFVGTVVLACKETMRADEIIQEHKSRMDRIHEAEEIDLEDDAAEYPAEIARKEKAVAYIKTGGSFVKLYAPSVALGGASLACILYSNKILKSRYLAAVSAFNAISAAYETYRGRIRAELGEDFDRHILTGSTYTEVDKEIVDEKGKKKKVKEQVEVIDPNAVNSEYCRWFDETNRNWDQNTEFSLMFLRAQQQIFTDQLRAKGHVFLNDVLEALGYEHSQVGSLVGWIKGMGDDFVDFGLYDPKNDSAKAFINGINGAVLLNFNVDGVIWDKI